MISATLLSGSGEGRAVMGFCLGLLALLVSIQVTTLAKDRAEVRALITASILAALLCLAAGIAATTWMLVVAIASCVLIAASTAVALHGSRIRLGQGRGLWPRHRGRGATLTFTVGLLLLVGAGVTFGVLLAGDGGSEPADTVAISSPYRVSGTCVNGACTVNECKTAAPCGQENEGELREGTPLDIVCQTKGEPATAPNGSRSRIWDRLESGLYISDLFVEGTATGRFTSDLLQCAEA